MSSQNNSEILLPIYVFETSQLLDQLEQSILTSEKICAFSESTINEIFRIMHTIKGSSAMMQLNNIAILAHAIEDVFYYIRNNGEQFIDYSVLFDYILETIDFIKVELIKVRNGDDCDGDASRLIESIKDFLSEMKLGNSIMNSSNSVIELGELESQENNGTNVEINDLIHINFLKAVIFFEDGCGMENLRAFSIINSLCGIAGEIFYEPEDIIESENSVNLIKKQGFQIFIKTSVSIEKIQEFFKQTVMLKSFEIIQFATEAEFYRGSNSKKDSFEEEASKTIEYIGSGEEGTIQKAKIMKSSLQNSIISVNVEKLDRLMDLVGELVVSESIVIQNPDLKGLKLDNFQKASRQLQKITSELQDMVMSIRMVPLEATFNKMHRVVRDMTKKLGKEVELEILGEDTEVDKNIIERISDPLMHLIRNAIDHGIETSDERLLSGKLEAAKVILEAKNVGGDVLVQVKDNGRGLCKEKILERAKEKGLLKKPVNEMTEREINSLIFLPGFSTKNCVTEYSGRGVGMDVVLENILTTGGSVTVDSVEGVGTTITIKIPLTLAIIAGMNIRVGNSRFTLPTISIKESFKPKKNDLVIDPDGNEMIMMRGECFSILRLHRFYNIRTHVTNFLDGIFIMVESNEKAFCIFADELIGEQQVVVKALPNYIKKIKKIKGITGCTLLGDGCISLILDIPSLMS